MRVEPPEKETEAEAAIQAFFMHDLEGFADDIVYIPGNHDPSTMFSRDRMKLPVLTSNSGGNVHRGIFKLRDDLIVLGLGGSLDAMMQKPGSNEMVGPRYVGYPYWSGAPFAFEDDLKELWNNGIQAFPDAQVIMMTHEGPYGSSTTRNHYFDSGEVVHCGSTDLRDLMLQNQDKVLFDVHGHTHEGAFTQNIGTHEKPLHVFNPGPLCFGKFAELVLKKDISGRWKVYTATQHYL